MPTNVWQKNAEYLCPCCRSEQYKLANNSDSDEEIQTNKRKHKHKIITSESDSEEEESQQPLLKNDNTTTRQKRKNMDKGTHAETKTETETATQKRYKQNETDSHRGKDQTKQERRVYNSDNDKEIQITKRKRKHRIITSESDNDEDEPQQIPKEHDITSVRQKWKNLDARTHEEAKTNIEDTTQKRYKKNGTDPHREQDQTTRIDQKTLTRQKRRHSDSQTHNEHDRDKQGKPTLGIRIVAPQLWEHVNIFLGATVTYTLGDGHCLRRSLGKIENVRPGIIVKKMKTYCENALQTKTKLYIDSKQWYQKMANPPETWLKLETNVKSDTHIYAGVSELHIWAIITKKPMISFNAVTGTATVYKPDEKIIPTVHTDLQQTHKEVSDQYNTTPGYVLFDNVNHYNAVLVDAQRNNQKHKKQKHGNDAAINTNNKSGEEINSETAGTQEKVKRLLKSTTVTQVQKYRKTTQTEQNLVEMQMDTEIMTTDAGTGAGLPQSEERTIRLGHKTPLANHIKDRIAKIVGKTINEALTTTIMTNKGGQQKYKRADLEYDTKKNFITMNDTINETIKQKTKKRSRQNDNRLKNDPLTKDEWRRKWKFK